MTITAILPVSRPEYLDRVLNSLMSQTRLPDALVVIYDGPDTGFLEVRNKVVELELKHVLCVASDNRASAHSIPDRRRHIVSIHNQIRGIIADSDWVFSVEDDGILPVDALEKLISVAKQKDAGIVTGVELGRWGVPYVGAWVVDDVWEPTKITSLENKTAQPELVEEIDACGLYCALIRTPNYKMHEFFTSNGLGPDVNLALDLRRSGFKNYIHWGVHVTHLTKKYGLEIEIPATDTSRVVTMKLLSGSTWQASH